eukprot:6516782-Prymnesium_polylepis.1
MTCRPRLYVHPLPDSYRDVSSHDGPLGAPLVSSSGLYASDHHDHIGPLLHERALAYSCRVHDPSTADLFFIPAYRSLDRRQSRCAERVLEHETPPPGNTSLEESAREQFLSRLRPALDARGGADHVLLQPRLGM